jgi:hypothetical protein
MIKVDCLIRIAKHGRSYKEKSMTKVDCLIRIAKHGRSYMEKSMTKVDCFSGNQMRYV